MLADDRYRSYPPETLIDLLARCLALVPPWTRIYRIQRDIPSAYLCYTKAAFYAWLLVKLRCEVNADCPTYVVECCC